MNGRLVDRIPFAKILTILAITFGVSLGLCGLTFVLSVGGNGKGGSVVMSLGILELAGMALSAAGFVLTAIVWVAFAATASFKESANKPQELFDNEKETDKNNEP